MPKLNLTPDEVVRVLAHRAQATASPDSLDLFRHDAQAEGLARQQQDVEDAKKALFSQQVLISEDELKILNHYQQWLNASESKQYSWLQPANIVDHATNPQGKTHHNEARLEQMQAAYNQFFVLLSGVNLLIHQNKQAKERGDLCDADYSNPRHLYQICLRSLPALRAQLAVVAGIYNSNLLRDETLPPDEVAERALGFHPAELPILPFNKDEYSQEQIDLLAHIRMKVSKSHQLGNIMEVVKKQKRNAVQAHLHNRNLRDKQEVLNKAALCLDVALAGLYAWNRLEREESDSTHGDFVKGFKAIYNMVQDYEDYGYNFPSPHLIEFV